MLKKRKKRSLIRRLYDFYDSCSMKLVRDSEQSETALIKTRAFLILWTATTTVMWLYVLYCFFAFGPGHPVPWGGILFSLLHTLSPLVFYFTQSIPLAGLNLSLTGFGFQSLFIFYTGGIYSPATIWLTFHPVIMGFFGNTSLIIFSVLLNFVIMTVMLLLEVLDKLPQDVLPHAFRNGMIISSYFGLDVLVAMFTIIAIRINTKRNNQLQESRELTENLLRILCHDINNPLMIIKNSSLHLNPDELRRNPKYAERIKKACEDIQSLTGSIGSWMAYRDGKIKLSSNSVSLKEIVNHINFSFDDKLQEKDLELNIFLPPGEHFIAGDKTAITYQIYSNLISNAIKFSYEKSCIDIHFLIEGKFIVTRIRDYGVGISDAIIDKIFSPYVRTTSRGTRNERGTGFGLPIVAAVVKRMNGSISVENMAKNNPTEKGTQFTVKLPRVQD